MRTEFSEFRQPEMELNQFSLLLLEVWWYLRPSRVALKSGGHAYAETFLSNAL